MVSATCGLRWWLAVCMNALPCCVGFPSRVRMRCRWLAGLSAIVSLGNRGTGRLVFCVYGSRGNNEMEWHFINILIEPMTSAMAISVEFMILLPAAPAAPAGISDIPHHHRVCEANAIQIDMEASSFPDAEYPASTDGYTTGSYPALGYATLLICRTKQCSPPGAHRLLCL
jgi:hypothetical protein